MKQLYKFLRTGLKSQHGNCVWTVGEWKHEDAISLCDSGFHASEKPLDALSYVMGEVLALVEVKGKSLIEKDKQAWSDMRVTKAYRWTKEDSVKLAIFAAEQVLEIFEREYPNDLRPRQAVEAAKSYLKTPAPAADAAYAARAADAADAAAAAYAAYAAARAAYATLDKINEWITSHIQNLQEIA